MFTRSPAPMPAPQSLIFAAVVGGLAGAYASIWGMYRDSIYQGFGAGRFVGSVVVGTVAAMALQSALRLTLPQPAALMLLFGLAYGAHRGIYQSGKIFTRPRDESELFIPNMFSSGSVSVTSRSARVAASICYVIAVGFFLAALAQLDRNASGPPTLAKSAFAGLVAGLIVATGGAWRDAPAEGFQTMRFIRSPSMTIPLALLLSLLTQSYLCLAIAAIGYERAAVETWKVFCAHVASRLRTGPWS